MLHLMQHAAAEAERLEGKKRLLYAFLPFDYVFTSRSFLKNMRLFWQLLIMLY